jgi:cob(I)alamin adenosyltransferase
MSVYTRKGDRGITRIFDRSSRKLIEIKKNSTQIEAIGAVDELNSFLGIVRAFMDGNLTGRKVYIRHIEKKIVRLQSDLFLINAILAGSDGLKLNKGKLKLMEKEIDEWEGELPVQKNFIYYGGSYISSLLFFARALVRRLERLLYSPDIKNIDSNILSYVNRLSDWLFVLARKVNFDTGVLEEYWTSKKPAVNGRKA